MRIYRCVGTVQKDEEGRVVEYFQDVPVGGQPDEKAIQCILAIPRLTRLRFYDQLPSACYIYGLDAILRDSKPAPWFVSYGVEEDPPRFGPGGLMIIERDTGRILYDGSDGGE
jgi:hypothetical protein